jgi:hypothetical protein
VKLTDLAPGTVYVARRTFADARGVTVLEGDTLTVERVTVAPVSAEIAVACREETLHFRADLTPEIVEHAQRYVAEAPAGPR